MTGRVVVAILASCMAAAACRPADAAKANRADSAVLAQREARLEHSLSQRDSTPGATAERKAVARWVLPGSLDEISGLALTSDGRLLAEQDERAQISEIDYRRGVVTKQFVVGQPTIKADLEAITVANDNNIYLLASNGTLYQFREGENGDRVDYSTHDTRLGKDCEFEGLAYDSTINSLLLACKSVKHDHLRDSLVIYRWKIHGGGDRISMLTVPLSAILPSMGKKEFHPSDITVDPLTGNYVIIGSAEKGIVEITPTGQVVFARKLPGDHDQPEGIAITRDSIMIISDEAKHGPAAITLYPWP